MQHVQTPSGEPWNPYGAAQQFPGMQDPAAAERMWLQQLQQLEVQQQLEMQQLQQQHAWYSKEWQAYGQAYGQAYAGAYGAGGYAYAPYCSSGYGYGYGYGVRPCQKRASLTEASAWSLYASTRPTF